MESKRLKITALVFTILMSCIFSYVYAGNDTLRKFKIGVIGENPDKAITEFEPMANYIANQLKEFNVEGGKVVVEKDLNGMINKIKNQEVDIFFDTPFAICKIQEKTDMIPSMLVWKNGLREYRTVFFVRKESPINKLTDLKGKIIVFEDPGSTSSYAIPKAELRKKGLTVAPEETKGLPANAVRYVFATGEMNQAFWVIQRKADVGAFNNGDWDELPEKIRAELKIIYETEPILRSLAAFHPHLPKKFRNAVEDILFSMDKSPEGKEALHSVSRISKIERLTDDDLKSLKYVKDLMRFID